MLPLALGGFALLFIGLAGINVLLTLAILYVYLMNYRRGKNPFTFSLIVFAGLFLFENVLDLFFLSLSPHTFSGFIGTYTALVNVVQLAGLLVLARLTWK